MVLPFVAAVMRDVFSIAARSHRPIGRVTWEAVRGVVCPIYPKGVIGGVMLGLGRTG
jgi:ABC-type phosphate transport system permease subunit